jgi:RNA polymerase sigma-70 factor, ECF subfamily
MIVSASDGRPWRSPSRPLRTEGLSQPRGSFVFVSENNGVNQTGTSATVFEALRGRLFGLAYRMLGSRAEAEDIVQEAYVRWHEVEPGRIENAEAWLVTTTSRLAIDRLRRLKTERETYVGPWLPEPIVAPGPPDRDLDLADDLSVAFLTLLERLAPEERAAFLLHDVFDVGYGEIASVIERSAAACRQVVHRARERVRGDRKRFDATESAKTALLQKFTAAVQARDEQALLALFAPDATWTADGGGKAPAAAQPIVGAERIARLLIGLREKFWTVDRTMDVTTINGEPGLCIRDRNRLTATMSIATDGERILAVYAVVNPEKLP